MAYRAVIFDLFGTLIPSFSIREYHRIIDRMAAETGCPLEAFRAEWNRTLKDDLLGYYPSLAGRVTQIMHKLGVPVSESKIAESVRIYYGFHRVTLRPRPEAVGLLQEVKIRGLKTGLITDCSPETPAAWPGTTLAPWLDVTVFSSREGIKKPDRRIYQIAIERLKVMAGECLYVGDGSSRELSGAEAAGLTPVQLYILEEHQADVLRIDWETWSGRTITSLQQVIDLL